MIARTCIAVVAMLSLSACADRAPGGPEGATGRDPADHGTQPSDLLFQVGYQGGFTPVEYQLTNLPSFSLCGDGTIVTPGAQTAIYPGPALPSIERRMLTEEGVSAILEAALDTGLADAHDMTDLGDVAIADAADTVFTIHTDDVHTTVRVYALGMTGLDGQPQGMVRDAFETRKRLARLVDDLNDLSWLPPGAWVEGEPIAYEPTGVKVFVAPYRGDPGSSQDTIPWPLAEPLGTIVEADSTYGYGCAVVAGSDWTNVLGPVAGGANGSSPWRSEGERYSVVFRPLLPDEAHATTC